LCQKCGFMRKSDLCCLLQITPEKDIFFISKGQTRGQTFLFVLYESIGFG
jgi:hypothetical protein